ncbi:iron complex transport system permease protein [Psychromicrobium silvestre]|uniref:Iron complex transport system permease protein n=1 Tax=Psychromicrobium silvestre TaxID=1645614 RepID=A0A7Y9LUE4_9MICC|nr:iron chelate uptake ABC transporter family permease subunit [Psychromicrobium silvestre]NYE95745.1 iron complex transport system permease protein [Psychromicrobium silvestre]
MSSDVMGGVAIRAVELLRSQRRKGKRRAGLICAALGILTIGLLAVDILLGSFTVTIPDFFAMLFGKTIPGASFIVMENKFPRALLALLVGAAFGVSGSIFQTLLRNPLASPDIIGISSGASASAVAAIVFFAAGGVTVSLIAIVGAVLIALLVVLLAGKNSGGRLILIGLGVAAMMNAFVTFVMQRAEVNRAQDAMVWLMGSLNSANWERVGALALGFAVLLPFVLLLASRLSALQLGEDAASGLGIRVGRTRIWLIVVGVTLAALATAAAGPVAFVAFLSGPIARRLLGGRVSLLASALVGASIVLAADYIAAYLIPGGIALPVGVVTGAMGAPFLLWLLISSNRQGNGA